MEKIEAGLLKKLLDTIKSISEALFNYLGASDLEKSNMQIDEKSVKKKSENVYSLSGSYIEKNGSKASTPLPFDFLPEIQDCQSARCGAWWRCRLVQQVLCARLLPSPQSVCCAAECRQPR